MCRTVAFHTEGRSALGAGTALLTAVSSLVILLFFALVLSSLSRPAWAHTVTIGQSKIRQAGEVVRYDLAVSYDELAKRVGVSDPAGSQPPETTDAEREARLRDRKEELGAYLGSQVRIFLDGVGCEDTLEMVDIVHHGGELYAVMSLSYRCPGSPSGTYEIHYDIFFDPAGAAQRLSHANVADYWLGEAAGRFVFERGNQLLVAGGASLFSSARRFVVLGFEHILGGIDHVLFVLALLLGARSVMSVVKVVAAFTAAHSVTLALASMGWLSVPSSIVEPLIALSIAYVAIENIMSGEARHRLFVVFGFGLMHGLGFAGNLSFTDQVSWRLISSLFAFNVGIELGQVVIVLLVCPFVLLARRLQSGQQRRNDARLLVSDTPAAHHLFGGLPEWSRFAQVGASGLIASFGVLLVFERLFLA